jgi:hypothetical protein
MDESFFEIFRSDDRSRQRANGMRNHASNQPVVTVLILPRFAV